MSDVHTEILTVLVDLDAGVRTMATAQPKPDLLAFFSKLDRLTAQLPAESAPELRHYLQKKSYEKARLFLQDRFAEIQKGGCDKD